MLAYTSDHCDSSMMAWFYAEFYMASLCISCLALQVGPKISQYRESSLNRIKNRQ